MDLWGGLRFFTSQLWVSLKSFIISFIQLFLLPFDFVKINVKQSKTIKSSRSKIYPNFSYFLGLCSRQSLVSDVYRRRRRRRSSGQKGVDPSRKRINRSFKVYFRANLSARDTAEIVGLLGNNTRLNWEHTPPRAAGILRHQKTRAGCQFNAGNSWAWELPRDMGHKMTQCK